MKFTTDQSYAFRHLLLALEKESLSLFAGAGLSVGAGYVDWKELLREIASDLELDIEKEQDLISIAQYHVNSKSSRAALDRQIMDEFMDKAKLSRNHELLSQMPIRSYWTTNYDGLIEQSLSNERRLVDVKRSVDDLLNPSRKVDAVVYKMHGDYMNPSDAVITKEDYIRYHLDKQAFITTLSAELLRNQFLFIGFSFNDPNLDYILSRVRLYAKGKGRQHFFFTKVPPSPKPDATPGQRAEAEYSIKKHQLHIADLKSYDLQAIEVQEYSEITDFLFQLAQASKRKSIFISGSAEQYGEYEKNDALAFLHKLSAALVESKFQVVNGFGWGVGSAIINGALDTIFSDPTRYSESQLIIRPFPQFSTGGFELPVLWDRYRRLMQSKAGVSIFCFGNKSKEGQIVDADGVYKEFQISLELGHYIIPIKKTGYMSAAIADSVLAEPSLSNIPEKYYSLLIDGIINQTNDSQILTNLTSLLTKLNKH